MDKNNWKKDRPRVLVCSVGAWNSKVGDNTLQLLLQSFPPECVAHLFTREDMPDSEAAGSYFRISEGAVIRSIVKRKLHTGCRVEPVSALKGSEQTTVPYHPGSRKFYYLKLMGREILWSAGKWKTQELDAFIDDFKPEIVIYEMSRYIYLSRIIRYILKRSGAKGIGCFWDDTFTYKQRKNIGYKVFRFFQRRSLQKLAADTTEFFAITPKTKEEADEFFHVNCTVLTKPITGQTPYEAPLQSPDHTVHLLYTGNLWIGRAETLGLIVEELKKLQESGQGKFFLDIYTNTQLTEEEHRNLNSEVSKVHAPVSQKRVLELQKEADVLVFVESLRDDNKTARLSFSTKITDYYAAGKCILAAGNADLAPIDLLRSTDSALVATDQKELKECVSALSDYDLICHFSEKAYETGRKNHSQEAIESTFLSVLEKLR